MLKLPGRTDVDDYFAKSGIREFKRLRHTPFLAFREGQGWTNVEIVDSIDKLLMYPDEAKVMGLWPGKHHSDYVNFTVGQLRQFVAAHPKESFEMV